MRRLNIAIVAACLTFASVFHPADAQRRGGGGGGGFRGGGGGARGGGGGYRGGGGGMSRGGARTSVTRPARGGGSVSRPSAAATRPSSPPARAGGGQLANRPSQNPSGNLGGGANIGNRGDRVGGDRTNIGSGDRVNNRPINIQDNDIVGGGGNWGYGNGCCYGWGAAAAGFVAGAAIGSLVYSLPPSCPAYVYGGVSYNHCGGVWYAPQFEGTETTYIVVETPPGAPPDTAAPPPPSAPPK